MFAVDSASGGEVVRLPPGPRPREREKGSRQIPLVSICCAVLPPERVVHRDLKPESLLLDADLDIEVVDFGFSSEFTFRDKLDTFCGSPSYAALSLFQDQKYSCPVVDVWNL